MGMTFTEDKTGSNARFVRFLAKLVFLLALTVAFFALPGSVFARAFMDESVVGGSLTQEEDAQVLGEEAPSPAMPTRPTGEGRVAALLGDVLWSLFVLFSFSALAVLVVMFWDEAARNVSRTIVSQPTLSGLVGLMTFIVVAPVLFLLAITILLSPISFVGFVLVCAAGIFGWISLGLEVGTRLARTFQREWSPPLAAGVGTLVLTFVTFSIGFFLGFIPCIGWILSLGVGLISFGGVMLSRFGKRVYRHVNSG